LTDTPRLLFCSGEASGDLYGAELVRHLRDRHPGFQVFGLGGDRLKAQGAELVAHAGELAVTGLLEVVRHLRRLRRAFRALLAEADRRHPDLAVLVDYPDFNLRLARQLHRRGVPIVYYVSPQVWAWRRGRIRTLREVVRRMLVIFPFEEELYRDAGVPVTFVGHPLVDLARPARDAREFLRGAGVDPDRPVIAVLPGSRRNEVEQILPRLAGALRILGAARPDLQYLVPVAPGLVARSFEAHLRGLPARLVVGESAQVLGASSLALVASGTATVEAALMGTPMIVVYRLSRLTYALGRPFVRVPHFAMVNLIAGRRVVPELIQGDFTPDRVAREALSLLEDSARTARIKGDLAEVCRRLGSPGASARAAEAVGEILREKKLDMAIGSM
jgi:lipid-A-disaccharide synthase